MAALKPGVADGSDRVWTTGVKISMAENRDVSTSANITGYWRLDQSQPVRLISGRSIRFRAVSKLPDIINSSALASSERSHFPNINQR